MPSQEDYKNEDQNIKTLFDNISTTIIFISQAFAMYNAFCFSELSLEEENQLRNEIFTFQTISLQFFIVVQFCKLFEGNKSETEAESSLHKLNNTLRNKYPDFFPAHSINSKLIKEIKKTEIYKLIKELRMKAYAHSDRHPLNTPLKFVFLTKEQTVAFKGIFLSSIEVLKNCSHFYDIGLGFEHWYNSSSPKVFIKQHLRTKKFWIDHFKEFPNS